jgi:hypothetical protein
MAKIEHKRMLRRARHARVRLRRKVGEIVVPVTINVERLDFLIRKGWVDANDAGDRARIGEAIARLLTCGAAALR